ncbi:MAG: polysaccharide deacetylase family protein [Candidatus Omnitrophica bacterium]|nr:polysaccharide deacetylase family protein [Candidatus Omnitrophota bacterium]
MKKFRIIAVSAVFLIIGSAAFVFMKTAYVVPVLMYHAIDYNDKVTKLSVSPESFEKQMKFLHENKYNVVTLEKLVSYIKNKDKIPPKTVVITLDDGFYNNYQFAYPVLKKYDIPATIFVIVEKIGQPGWLSWKDIKEMSDSGVITIGSHTLSHKWLTDLGTKQLKSELSLSKAMLEEKIGKPVNVLCYPIGAHNQRVEREAGLAGYTCAVATNPGRFSPIDDIYSIKRIKVSRTSDNLFVFWLEASGYYTWVKERRDN